MATAHYGLPQGCCARFGKEWAVKPEQSSLAKQVFQCANMGACSAQEAPKWDGEVMVNSGGGVSEQLLARVSWADVAGQSVETGTPAIKQFTIVGRRDGKRGEQISGYAFALTHSEY